MKVNRFASIVSSIYLFTIKYQKKSPFVRRQFTKIWEKCLTCFSGKTITYKIHNNRVISNFGYTYPIILRDFSEYNLPLIECVYQAYKIKKSPITIVDVGTAIGDTVLFLEASVNNLIEKYYCIEGDVEFYNYMKINLAKLEKTILINSFLSSTVGKARNLIKIHPGTASSQGKNDVSTTTLDSLIGESIPDPFDLLKIDVDGFDGNVIIGGKSSLKKFLPLIIFEWHPLLCVQTGNNWMDHFNALIDCGYNRFIFFDNFGHFSHMITTINTEDIKLLANICIANKHAHAVYFDIVAMHPSMNIDFEELASLDFAKSHKAKW